MSSSLSFRRTMTAAVVTTTFALLFAGAALAQESLTISDSDRAAAEQAKNVYRHVRPSSIPETRGYATTLNASQHAATPNSAAKIRKNVRFPGDLQFNGGPTLMSLTQHAVFVNTSGNCHANSCWGNPLGFLLHLGKSDFIHIVDQYTNTFADDRYNVGTSFAVTVPTTPGTPLTDKDMQAIALGVENALGKSGYTEMVHIFLPPGQDECFDNTFTVCYSPDKPKTFAFCAYHSSFDSSIGHTVYSVEPFQNVNGCKVEPGTPNGQLVDSTNNVLSHELIEAITDPDGNAWFNLLDNGLFGEEIGDECSFIVFTSPTTAFFDPSPVNLNGHKYAIQPEYNNQRHACTTIL